MNKWQIICPLGAMAIFAIVAGLSSVRSYDRALVHAQTRMIGCELIATTNSPRLSDVSPELRSKLSNFLNSSNVAAEVLFGDDSRLRGRGRAVTGLVLSNETGEKLGIRLGQAPEPGRFQVLDWWTVSEPAVPMGP